MSGDRGGFMQCPVCRRFAHTKDCPVRETMALEWTGTHPDEREEKQVGTRYEDGEGPE